jgi:hypothetical protein
LTGTGLQGFLLFVFWAAHPAKAEKLIKPEEQQSFKFQGDFAAV